jgi:hypothetical protein
MRIRPPPATRYTISSDVLVQSHRQLDCVIDAGIGLLNLSDLLQTDPFVKPGLSIVRVYC